MFSLSINRFLLVSIFPIFLTACTGSSESGDITSDISSNLNNSINDAIPPTQPSKLRLVTAPKANEVSLTWNLSIDNIRVNGYRIFRDGAELAFVEHNSYRDDTVSASNHYTYLIVAEDDANNTSTSEPLLITTPVETDIDAPTTPANVASSNEQSSQMTISWNASTDNVELSGYRVYRNGTHIATTVNTQYTDTGLNADTAYSYQIQAFDSSNNLSNSDALIASTLAVVSSRNITLSWIEPTRNTDDSCLTSIEGYILKYGNSPSTYSNSMDLPLNEGNISCTQTSFDNACGMPVMTCSYVTGVMSANNWYFAVQVYDQSGNISGLSNQTLTVVN